MVNFATMDMDEYPDIAKNYNIETPGVYVFKAGSKKHAEATLYEGEMSGKALSEFAYALLEESFDHFDVKVPVLSEGVFQDFLVKHPLQPKLMLYTTPEKAKKEDYNAPALMKTIAMEYAGYVQVAILPTDESEPLRRFFEGDGFDKIPVPCLILMQGEPQQQEGAPEGQYGIAYRSNVIEGERVTFNFVARHFDQIPIRWEDEGLKQSGMRDEL
jgi:hypothetical protein